MGTSPIIYTARRGALEGPLTLRTEGVDRGIFRAAVGAKLFLFLYVQFESAIFAEQFIQAVQRAAIRADFLFPARILQKGLFDHFIADVLRAVHQLHVHRVGIGKRTKTVGTKM